jgi:hypothetical protein
VLAELSFLTETNLIKTEIIYIFYELVRRRLCRNFWNNSRFYLDTLSKSKTHLVWFEVFTAVSTKMAVITVVSPDDGGSKVL